MQRNLSRIQRQDLINRQSNPSLAPAPRATAASGASGRKAVANTAAYGYGDRDDVTAYIARGKKMKFDNLPSSNNVELPKSVKESNIGRWEVSQVISKGQDDDSKDGVKKEESPEPYTRDVPLNIGTADVGKKERARTPDEEDLFRFRVQEKSFPTELKEEDDDVKVPVVGFKKRKLGGKSSRALGAL
jgi:hypothetical protein